MRRTRATWKQVDDLTLQLAREKENANYYIKLWTLLEQGRSRYYGDLCKAVVRERSVGKGGIVLDAVDHAIVVGAGEAARFQGDGFRTFSTDGGDLGRGSGPAYLVIRIGNKNFAAMRK